MVAVKVRFLVQTFVKKIKTSILAFDTLKTKIDADKTFIFRETVFQAMVDISFVAWSFWFCSIWARNTGFYGNYIW